MSRPLLACLLAGACSVPQPLPQTQFPVAVQVEGGLAVLHDGRFGAPVPGSAGVETFCWDRHGRGFYVTRNGTLSWLALAGGQARVLVDGFRALRFPAVSRDGVIAYGATRKAGPAEGWEIWTVREDGSGLQRIGPGYDPAWSPRGMYFEAFEPGPQLRFRELETGAVQPVPAGDGRGYSVACSPSGDLLAFSHAGALMLYSVRTGTLQALTDGDHYDRFASFSPDERWLVFYRQTAAGGERHWLVRLELASGREEAMAVGSGATPAYAPR